jgi:hypothetical protein
MFGAMSPSRACLALAACLAACARPVGKAQRSTGAGSFPIVATAEVHGTTEPCGCNSDPLGDLARVVALAQGGLLVDAGNLLYDGPGSIKERGQAERKAATIGDLYEKAGAEVALGPDDLVGGQLDKVRPSRQACNARDRRLAAPRVHEIGGVRVGVFGIAGRKVATELGEAAPAAEAAKRAIAQLERDHAEIIVALLSLSRAEARALLQEVPGVDFAIFGIEVGEGMPEPEPVGAAWLAAPADQARRVVKIEITRGSAPTGARMRPVRFDGEAGRTLLLARLDKRKTALEEQLASFAKDPSADAAFVAARRKELDELTSQRQRTASAPLNPPTAPYFTYVLQPVRQKLPRDPGVAATLQRLARDNGRANLAAASPTPPPPEPGRPRYLGDSACTRCHKAAAAFWKTTVHAQAWKTLVNVDKQYDYDCIGCHVTGWQEPGGSNLGSVEKQGLTSVQCEVCHGPGEKHVAEDGMDSPKTMHAPAADFCRDRCHTLEHSDTFALEPYLRDILGPGHGEARRKALGDGPTGHALRAKALAAAAR